MDKKVSVQKDTREKALNEFKKKLETEFVTESLPV